MLCPEVRKWLSFGVRSFLAIRGAVCVCGVITATQRRVGQFYIERHCALDDRRLKISCPVNNNFLHKRIYARGSAHNHAEHGGHSVFPTFKSFKMHLNRVVPELPTPSQNPLLPWNSDLPIRQEVCKIYPSDSQGHALRAFCRRRDGQSAAGR